MASNFGLCSKMHLAFGLMCLFALAAPGFTLECYRCNSSSLDCLEKFMYPNPLKSESCADVFEARFCIKTTGIYNDVLGTQRFCSSQDMGNMCHFVDHDDRQYKACMYTCYGDGCNSANLLARLPLLANLITAMAVILFTSRCLLWFT